MMQIEQNDHSPKKKSLLADAEYDNFRFKIMLCSYIKKAVPC
jgi:hypothetical protein